MQKRRPFFAGAMREVTPALLARKYFNIQAEQGLSTENHDLFSDFSEKAFDAVLVVMYIVIVSGRRKYSQKAFTTGLGVLQRKENGMDMLAEAEVFVPERKEQYEYHREMESLAIKLEIIAGSAWKYNQRIQEAKWEQSLFLIRQLQAEIEGCRKLYGRQLQEDIDRMSNSRADFVAMLLEGKLVIAEQSKQ